MESKEHRKLKKRLRTVFENCEFLVDTEVHLDINNDGLDDRSFDVCAVHGDTMIVVECKDSNKLRDFKREIAAWKQDVSEILENRNKIKVMSSEENKVKKSTFSNIEHIKLAYAFADIPTSEKAISANLKKEKIVFWNGKAVRYYEKVSSILGEWTKYEILREFDIFEETRNEHTEDAVKIRQSNNTELFLFGIHPGLLLRIGYVLRRTSTKSEAYQRAISKQRIDSISEFLRGSSIILPNSLILAFDSEIEDQIHYAKKTKQLTFPIRYCSAWVIDGQHRLYGFAKTKYRNWNVDSNESFKLPIVAFKRLDERMQNKTFVNINYYQKRIDSTLLCDLAAAIGDLRNELTWPSTLAIRLNELDPLKNMIRVSEFERGKPINLAGVARYSLLERLLGYKKRSGTYDGPLYKFAKFYPSLAIDNPKNKEAFDKQLGLLQRFFLAVRKNVKNSNTNKDPWINHKDYALTGTTSVNALLLVLNRIMEIHPKMNLDLDEYMKPIANVDFTRDEITKTGGWKGFTLLANNIIGKLNEYHHKELNEYQKRKTS